MLKDVEVLVRQRRVMWENMGVRDKRVLDAADPVYRKWARKQLSAGTLRAWLVEGRRGLVVGGGCLWLQPVQPQPGFNEQVQPYLMSMYTIPGFRGRRVASRIVREAVSWCRKNRHSWMVLHASKAGRRLYRRLGFERTWEMELEFTDSAKQLVRHGARRQPSRDRNRLGSEKKRANIRAFSSP